MGVIKFAYGIILALAGISFAIDDPVVNAAPALANDGADHYDVEENSIRGLVVAKFVVENVNSKNGLVLELESTDGLDVYVANLFNAEVYDIQDTVYAVITVNDVLDYESMPHAYGVKLTLKDDNGAAGCNQDTVIRTINLVDVNEAPRFEFMGEMFIIEENRMNGELLGALDVSDPDTFNVSRFGHLEYRILDETTPFTMDSNRIIVADLARLDYEALVPDTVFKFDVQVSNCLRDAMTGKYNVSCLYDNIAVTVYVKNANESPQILIDADDDGQDDSGDKCYAYCDTTNRGNGNQDGDSILVIGIDKNAQKGIAVFKYITFDEDEGDVSDLTPTLKDNDGLGAESMFSVSMVKHGNIWTVGVYVAKEGALKSNDLYDVTVTVRDSDGETDEIRRIIYVKEESGISSSSTVSSSSAESSSSAASSSSARSSSCIARSSSSAASSSSVRSSSSMARSSSSAAPSSSARSSSSIARSSSSVASSSSTRSSSSSARYSSSSHSGMSSSSNELVYGSSSSDCEGMLCGSEVTSSSMVLSSSSVLEIVSSSSDSRDDSVLSSSSYDAMSSSSSRGFFIRVSSSSEIFIDPRERRSSSSTEYFGEIFAEPTFRVKFQGPFQIVIVMDEPIASVTNRNFAVMDLQGRVLRQGTVYSTETIVQGLGKGSYVVKVGLGVRRVNIQ